MAKILKTVGLLLILIICTQSKGSEASPSNYRKWKSHAYEKLSFSNDIHHVVKNDEDLQTNEISHSGIIDYATSFFDILKIKKVS